jgi:hypothetical protein
MSYKNGRLFDGYALDAGANSFVTSWVNVHSSPFWNFICVFTQPVSGTLSIEASNDRDATWTDGSIYPLSAQFTGTYGTGKTGDPIDLIQVPGTAVTLSSSAGPVMWDNVDGYSQGAHFLRVKFVATSHVACTSTITFSFKSSS